MPLPKKKNGSNTVVADSTYVLKNVTTENEEHYKVNNVYMPYLLAYLQNIS
jgi:hypothetical protein